MAVLRKAKALPLILALLLCGCSGKTLTRREIIRAAYFEQAEAGYTVTLLVEDQEVPEGQQGYKTTTAQGVTPEQALSNAEQALQATAFYGLMDLAMLPAQSDWKQATGIGALLYEKAQPAPEISMFLLDGEPVEGRAGALYDAVQAMEKETGVLCGLQQLFVQQDCCTVPIWQQEGYGFAILPQDGQPHRDVQAAAAQLAAALCGQAGSFSFSYGAQAAFCSAGVGVTVEVRPDETAVQLHLTDTELTPLTPAVPDEQAARVLLCETLQEAFASLCAANADAGIDPFRLGFWAACKYGAGKTTPAPKLEICFE